MLALLAALAAASWAQLTRGFISGTVSDATGAVVEGVAVKITNTATNISTETQTNAVGFYRFVAVEPGVYRVEYRKQGFEVLKIENVIVGTAQEVVLNQALTVGATTTTVEIQAVAASIELAKSSATLERKLSQQMLENLPLAGGTRDVNTLALLTPTATRAPGSTGIAANGQRARNNNFMIDGVDNNDLSVTLANARVIAEGLSEFQVQTNPYSAEFGRNTGAQISVITRGGSNTFKGEVWDYYRANWMEPVSLLNKRAGVTSTPRFVQNQAGGSLGGPIIRDRLFFFGLLEANRRREAPDARNAASATIPTADGYAALQRVALGPGQTQDSRQAVLSAITFLPDIHKIVGTNYQNVRNVTVNGTPIQVGTIRIPLANPYDFWYQQGRVDYRLTNNDNLSYRIQIDKRNQPDVVSNLQFGNKFSGAQTILSQNHALSHSRTFSPRFINEFRFSFVRRNLNFPENDPKTSTATISGFFTIGGASNFPQGRVQNTFQWQNVSTYMLNRHSLKFGIDIRRNRLFNRAGFDSKGTWTFNSLEDYVNNRAFSLAQAINEATFDARQTNQYYFFQDDIKVTKNLTVNLGFRYEYSGAPFGFFGATEEQVVAALVPRPVRPDKNNWAPRGALAWSPTPKDGLAKKLFGDGQTVFRGGWGMGYDVLFYNILTVNASNYPRVVVQNTTQPETFNLYPRLAPKVAGRPAFDPLATFVNSPEDTQNPTTHFYSFSIQRQLRSNYVVEVGYTGSRSYHGIRQGQLNPGILTAQQAAQVIATQNPNSIPSLQNRRLYPRFGSRVTIESTALANYNAMFIRVDKKMSRGLTVGGNYTWSALLSDNDESLGVADIVNSSPQVPQDYFNYRNEWSRSVFDRPHRLALYYNYQIPWFKQGAIASKPMRHVFAGWSIAGFSDWQSGQPFTIRTGVDSAGIGTATPARPNYNPNGVFTKDPVSGDLRTFTTPIDGTGIVVAPLGANRIPMNNTMPGGGNLGRNTFRGPAFTNWNFGLHKTISIAERWRVQLRADWTNLWNHRNFGNPVATMNSPAFGTNTTDPGARSMLVSAKIRF